jgi:hypothetical protein
LVFVYIKRFPLTRLFMRAKRLLLTLFVELETLSMPNATVRANARALPEATEPESAADEYLRLQSAKIVADALFEVADKKMKAEADAKAEAPKLGASRAFAQAFHAWLAAKAGIEDPLLEDDEQPGRFRAESDAERRLFTTPSAYPDQVWQKLEAFEDLLNNELVSGQRRDSVLLLALVLIPEEAAPQFRDDVAPRNGMMPPPDSEMISPPITE